jgi:hypothetical protein
LIRLIRYLLKWLTWTSSRHQADKKEAEKQVQLEKLMKDMQTPSGSSRGAGTEPGVNPFGPHGRNDREDAFVFSTRGT